MNHSFAAAKPGASFKGAMAYYMHDKDSRDTSERVAWTSTRNLASDRPEVATALMVATARDADRLKAEAGIKATGRKAKAPVKTFALSWHPDEAAKLDRAEMERAANGALKAIGMEDHQVVIICHRDTKHPHVHVMVNRVNPNTGKLAPTGPKENRALDRWAYEYERDRGQIVSPNRAAKHERQDALRNRYSEEERRAYIEKKTQEKAAEAQTRKEAIRGKDTPVDAVDRVKDKTGQTPSQAQVLRDLAQAQKAAHKRQWADLRQSYRDGRMAIRAEWTEKFREARRAYDAANRPRWKQFGRDQRRADRQRETLERSFTGRLSLSITAAREQQKALAKAGQRASLVGLTWANLRNADLRNSTFAKIKAQDKEQFKRWYDRGSKPEFDRLKELRGHAYAEHYARFQRDRDALMLRQAEDRAAIKEAWSHIPRERPENRTVRDYTPSPNARDRQEEQSVESRDQAQGLTSGDALERLKGQRASQRQEPGDALSRLRASREAREQGGMTGREALDRLKEQREGQRPGPDDAAARIRKSREIREQGERTQRDKSRDQDRDR